MLNNTHKIKVNTTFFVTLVGYNGCFFALVKH